MQACQTSTEVRQFPTICTPFLILFVGGGVRVRLETLSFRDEKMYFKADTRG